MPLHPTAVFVRRNDRKQDRSYTPQVSERVPVHTHVERRPLPPEPTLVWDEGKTYDHAWPHVQRYQSTSNESLHIMGWPFSVPKVALYSVVSMPRGAMLPVRERTNIDMPDQTSYGALAGMQGHPIGGGGYAKLT